MKHWCELPVLGITVRFETNALALLEVIEETFGLWASLRPFPELISSESVAVRFTVHPGDEGDHPHAPLSYRMPHFERVELTTPGSQGVADATRREVVARVTEALVADRAHFRYGVLEALTLALLTRFDRVPFHAAGIVRDGRALLLAGPTGSGKSTLCYVAQRAGFEILADDAVYLQLTPPVRVWGIPGHLHLPVHAAAEFPELAGTQPSLLANGKEKIAVDVRAAGAAVEPPVVMRAAICLLTRDGHGPSATSLEPAALRTRLGARPEEGFDVFSAPLQRAADLLAREKGWVLDRGRSPQDSLPLLHRMFDSLEGGT